MSPSDDALRRYGAEYGGLGGIRLVTLADGPGRGIRVLEFRTLTGLTFDVAVDRGMDILTLDFKGQRVSWSSPTGTRAPEFFESEAEQGLGLMRGMTGMLVTAGLDHIFGPSTSDARRYAYPPRTEMRHPLHGRVSNTPALLRGYGVESRNGTSVLWAEGEIRQASVLGENLRLLRRIEVDQRGSTIRLFDDVFNDGFVPTPHALLYHLNFGWPFLDEHTRFSADIGDTARRGYATRPKQPLAPIPAPTDGFVEQCLGLDLMADRRGWTRVAAYSPTTGASVQIAWNARTLPAFVQWVNAQPGSYSVALEPATHGIGAVPDELPPGGHVHYELTIEVAPGEMGVDTSSSGKAT